MIIKIGEVIKIHQAPYGMKDVLINDLNVEYYNGSFIKRSYTPDEAFELSLMFPTAKVEDCHGVIERYRDHLRRMNPIPAPVSVPDALTEPRDYQMRSVGWALTQHYGRYGSLLAADMGTGKTAITWYLTTLIQNFKKCLITPPFRVMDHWVKEYHKHIPNRYAVAILNQKSPKDKATFARHFMEANVGSRPVVLILNHESVWKPEFAKWAKSQMWDLTVVDECHRLQTPSGRFSMFMRSLARQSRYRVGLSGFPITNNYQCIYGQFVYLNDRIFGTSITSFNHRYAVREAIKKRNKNGEEVECNKIIGYRRLKEIHSKYHTAAYRVRRDDVLNLPPIDTEIIDVELSSKERRIYNDLMKEYIAETEHGIITAANCLVKSAKLRRICQGHAVNEDGEEIIVGDSKIKAFESFLEDFPMNEHFVIFCEYTIDIHRVFHVCKNQGRQVGILNGQHDDYTHAWCNGEINTLVVQEKCGATGLDELKKARYFATYGCGWSLQIYEQKLARFRRDGQERSMVHYAFVARNTKDIEVQQSLVANKKAAVALIDGLH